MSNLNTFNFGVNPVRTVVIESEPWFVASDVCAVLGLNNVGQAISALDPDDKCVLNHGALVDMGVVANRDDLEITRLAFISEPGLYSLVFKSIKPEAKAFKKWVTSEVLPSIRKTGSYGMLQQHGIPKTLSEALRFAAKIEEEREALSCKVQTLTPKAAFHDSVAVADDGQSIGEVAKVLGTGQNRLFAWLRGQGYLMASNLPYQDQMDAGRFRVIEQTWSDKDGNQHVSTKTLITGKGLIWLQRIWNSEAA